MAEKTHDLSDLEVWNRTQTQKAYFRSLLGARLDADYVVDRHRIGQAHADAGLKPDWFLGAYNSTSLADRCPPRGGSSSNRRGTGLGLYFVKRLIEEHGGRVWVQSQLGVGSKFYVAIPVS